MKNILIIFMIINPHILKIQKSLKFNEKQKKSQKHEINIYRRDKKKKNEQKIKITKNNDLKKKKKNES
jgi:sortase (surface protein transpeptidase)